MVMVHSTKLDGVLSLGLMQASLSADQERDSLLNMVMQNATRVLGVDRSTLFLVDRRRSELMLPRLNSLFRIGTTGFPTRVSCLRAVQSERRAPDTCIMESAKPRKTHGPRRSGDRTIHDGSG